MKKEKRKRPWLDSHGRPLSDDKLRINSRAWDESTWERFLESMEVPLSETLVSPKKLESLAENFSARLFQEEKICSSQFTEAHLKRLERALGILTPRQRVIVRRLFWLDQTPSQIANDLRISLPGVLSVRSQVLNKLGRLINFKSRGVSDE